MRALPLVRLPGTGMSRVDVEDAWTVEEFVARFDLAGRDIILDGRTVPTGEYRTTTLGTTREIFAVASSKGA
jgi:hypothetical protein